MKNKSLLFAVFVLLSTTMPPFATAQVFAAVSTRSVSGEEKQSSPTLQDEIAAFSQMSVSAREGIAAVEEHLSGSKVVDISFDGSQDVPVYRVKAFRRGQIWSGTVDASTRSVVLDDSMPVVQLDGSERDNVKDIKRAEFDLSDAVTVAEKYGKGKAISAGLSRADGRLLFLVVVVSDGTLKEVSLSPVGQKKR